MGVEAESVSSAIFECEKDGNHFCVILNSQIIENNVKYWDSARKMYKKTTAQTVVKGSNLNRLISLVTSVIL